MATDWRRRDLGSKIVPRSARPAVSMGMICVLFWSFGGCMKLGASILGREDATVLIFPPGLCVRKEDFTRQDRGG